MKTQVNNPVFEVSFLLLAYLRMLAQFFKTAEIRSIQGIEVLGSNIMKRFAIVICLVIFMIIFSACSNDDKSKDNESTSTPTSAPETTSLPNPTPTQDSEPSITDTPMDTANLPAIELLSGSPDTCQVTEGYSELVGYEANFYETTTENLVVARLLDGNGNVLVDESSQGENKDGAEGWGWYPPIYSVPEDTALTVELTVYLSEQDNVSATSLATLTYNCTTGETLDTTFTRNP